MSALRTALAASSAMCLTVAVHVPLAHAQGAAPVTADVDADTAARRAELLRRRADIDAELQKLEAPAAAEAVAPPAAEAAAARRDGVETVVVTGHSGRDDRLPIAQSASGITREQFAYMPAASIAEVLAMSPGVTFVQGNGPRDVSISVRGSNNRQTYGVRNIKVFEDGFDVTQPDGLARTDLTDPHAYGAIGVVRGPSSAWYGNYATGGAVEFHLRPGADIRGVEAGLDAGSYGYLNAYVAAGAGNERYDVSAFLSNVRGGGATDHTDYLTTTANLLTSVQLTPQDRLVFKLIDNELDTDLSLRLSLNQFRSNPYQHGCDDGQHPGAGCATLSLKNNGFNGDAGTTTVSPAQAGIGRHDRRTIVGLRWEHALDDATQWQTQLVFDNRDIKQPTSSSGFDGTYPSWNLRSDLRHEGTLLGLPSLAAAGVFYNDEEINSSQYNLTPEGHASHGGVTVQTAGRTQNAGLRLREELQLAPRWTAVLGLGGEYTQMDGRNTAFAYPPASTPTRAPIDAAREFYNVAPELAVQFAASAQWTLHARVASAYGTPQLTNLFVNADGDPGRNTQLDPQRNLGFDLGSDWHYGEVLSLSLSGFYEFFRDELVSQVAGVGKQSYTFNAPKSEHRGVEAGLALRPLPTALPGAKLTLAYLYDDQIYRDYTEVLVAGSDVVRLARDGNTIPGVQPQTLNARLAYDQPAGALQGLGAYIELNARDGFELDNANTLQAPGYGVVNLNVHYAPDAAPGWLSRCDFYFTVQNLFDRTYVSSASNLTDKLDAASKPVALDNTTGSIYAGTPRVYTGGLRYRF
ncbi:TonB-dependent receptor family protein [Solimonas soli]|uniref:TonB-dependent receptor family protein n=1 Tax=Solimonas soli TaxID=413479 RepID=UPI0004832F73|nr:TonB-dependent receptor [Solimonas soli]